MKKCNIRTLWQLFYTFFKAGTFTFAGGLAMLPVLEKDLVVKYALISKEDFLEFATLSQTLPGVIALNCACFVGKCAAGPLGMLIAGFGATCSAFVLMLAATIAIRFIPQSGWVMGAMRGVRAASAAFVFSAAFSLGRHNIKSTFSVLLMLATFVFVFFLHVSAPLIVLAAGFAGFLYQTIRRKKEGNTV